MKKLLSIILTLVIILSTMCVSSFATKENLFNDISEHWAEGQIKRIADKGIISGYPDGTFKPDAPITRAEFAKIASVAFDLQVKSALNYDDVKPEDWYYSYLENSDMYIPIYALPISYETNIPYQTISQQGLNNFLPNTPAMRMHIAEALVKIKMEKENINIDIPHINIIQQELLSKFNDAEYEELFVMHGEVPANVKRMFEYTWLASELGIMQGDDKGNFNPYGNVTRAELVTMIDRMLVKVSGTPLFCDYSDLFDMELDDINIMEIQSGTTGEIIKINSRETIAKVFSLLSTSQYKTDVRSGNYDGWSYAVTMLSNDGEQLFRYVINTGIKIGEHNYLIEDDTYKFKNLIKEIYNTPLEKKKFADISDITLDDIDTMEIQSGTTGEFVKINSRESIENVFSILSEGTYTQKVSDGNYGGFLYSINFLSKDGKHLFKYTINSGVKVDDIDYTISETEKLSNVIYGIYNISENAEKLSYSEIVELQNNVDNGHQPWRLNSSEVIKNYMTGLGINNGEIKILADGVYADAIYTTQDNNVYFLNLVKPIKTDEYGILIVKSCKNLANFSDEEINSAKAVVEKYFEAKINKDRDAILKTVTDWHNSPNKQFWADEKIQIDDIRYESSIQKRYEYVTFGRGKENNTSIDNVIVITADFTVLDNGNSAYNKGEYKDYSMILIRDSKDGQWLIDDMGY